MQRLVEIRSYRLKPGSGSKFHDLVVNHSMPLLREQGTEVVAFGQSVHDPDAYFLLRAYDSLDHRDLSQEAFYSSAAWKNGPRQSIIDLIDAHWDIVLWLSPAAVDAMRSSSIPVAISSIGANPDATSARRG
jgi:NIPSNAP